MSHLKKFISEKSSEKFKQIILNYVKKRWKIMRKAL